MLFQELFKRVCILASCIIAVIYINKSKLFSKVSAKCSREFSAKWIKSRRAFWWA